MAGIRIWTRRDMLASLGAGLVATADRAPARADTSVEVAIVLAVDTSGSVNAERFELQRRGYADAFRSRDVQSAIAATRSGNGIAVTMTHWTGPALQVQVIGWTRITDAPQAQAFADRIAQTPRALMSGGTSISGAIDHGATLLAALPYRTVRRVIDVSGDGSNNRGRDAALARDDAVRADIVINGLPILALERRLDEYYQDNVIGGPGAFMIVAETYEQFGDAVRRKLILEIAGNTSGPATINRRG